VVYLDQDLAPAVRASPAVMSEQLEPFRRTEAFAARRQATLDRGGPYVRVRFLWILEAPLF